MPHVLFEDTHDWELVDSDQDIRGWEVRDANGNPVGTVGGMAVDTDAQVVDTIILTDGSRFRVEDVSLDNGVVYVTTYGAPAGVSARPYTQAHGIRRRDVPPEVAAEQAEGRREIAEEQAEMRREMREPDRVEEIREGRREIAEERAEARREVADAQRDAGRGAGGYSSFADDFQSNFREHYADSGLDYDDVSPAYRAGYDYAYDDRYSGRSWDDAEADLRADYYRRNGYPMSDNLVWNRVKGAVRHAYDRARNAV